MYQFQNYRRGQRVGFTCYDADRRTVLRQGVGVVVQLTELGYITTFGEPSRTPGQRMILVRDEENGQTYGLLYENEVRPA